MQLDAYFIDKSLILGKTIVLLFMNTLSQNDIEVEWKSNYWV